MAPTERLSTQDSSFVMFEQRATHMHVAAAALFEVGPLRTAAGGLDAGRIARYVESRLGQLPHYRQKLAFAPVSGHPVWVDDEHFDLDYHVRHTALPRPGSDEDLKRLAGRILSQPLDRDRPLWEIWIIEGLAGDRFALLNKVHHCMVDGASGVNLMTLLFRTDTDDTIPPADAWFPRPHPSGVRLALDEVIERSRAPLEIWRDLGSALRDPGKALRSARERAVSVGEALRTGFHLPSDTGLNRPIGPHRRVEWRVFDLAEIKSLARRLGGTVNDVVLTMVTGSVRRFLSRRREPLEEIDYRVVIPVNMRSASGDPGVANRVSAFFLSLPVAEPDPVKRFQAVHEETVRLKASRAADGIDFFTQLVERSGSTWLTQLGVRLAARVQPYNQTVSNVPGPRFPLYVLGARLLELYPLPPLFERQGLATAVLSYDGRVCWGLVADRDGVPDLAAMAEDVEAALEELRRVAPAPRAEPSGAPLPSPRRRSRRAAAPAERIQEDPG
jgi:diacylglycerol O-acyltransferase / wax synthase